MTFETQNNDALDHEASTGEVRQTFTESGPSESEEFSLEVGDRKYDMDSLAKKLQHLDKHVKTLEQENKQYRDKVAEKEKQLEELQGKSKTIEDVLKLEEEALKKSNTNKLNIDKDAIIAEINSRLESTLVSTIEQREIKKLEQSNFEKARDMIVSIYGDKTEDYIMKKSKELNLSYDDAVKLAKQSPDAFLKLYTDAATAASVTPTTSSYNSMAIKNKQAKEEFKMPNLSSLSGKDRTDAYLSVLKKYSSG